MDETNGDAPDTEVVGRQMGMTITKDRLKHKLDTEIKGTKDVTEQLGMLRMAESVVEAGRAMEDGGEVPSNVTIVNIVVVGSEMQVGVVNGTNLIELLGMLEFSKLSLKFGEKRGPLIVGATQLPPRRFPH